MLVEIKTIYKMHGIYLKITNQLISVDMETVQKLL